MLIEAICKFYIGGQPCVYGGGGQHTQHTRARRDSLGALTESQPCSLPPKRISHAHTAATNQHKQLLDPYHLFDWIIISLKSSTKKPKPKKMVQLGLDAVLAGTPSSICKTKVGKKLKAYIWDAED
jgi:hypothetical protein